MRTYHLDSNILIGKLIGRSDEQRHCRSIVARLNKLAHNQDVNIIVSQIVIGETIVKLYDRCSQDIENKISELLGIIRRWDAKTPPANREVYKIALKIIQNDNRLEYQPNDALIAAQALNDPYSERLITTDTIILESKYLVEIERELRNQGKRNTRLKFTDHV